MRFVSVPPGDGYGAAAQGYLGVLEHLGIPVRWEPVDFQSQERAAVSPELSRFTHWIDQPVDYDTVVVFLPSDRIPHHLHGERRRFRVAVTTGETDTISQRWVQSLAGVDRVVVPSVFNQRVFAASGVTAPISVVGYVGDLDLDVPAFSHESLGDWFVFYTIGSWTTRKGLSETVLAFADAFGGSDEVALVVKTGLVDHQALLEAGRARAAQRAAAVRAGAGGACPAGQHRSLGSGGDVVVAGAAAGHPADGATGAARPRRVVRRGHCRPASPG